MSKRAGILISALIIFVSLAIGLFIGFKFVDNGNSITVMELEKENLDLKVQINDLQNKFQESENKRLKDCKENSRLTFPNHNSKNFYLEFKDGISEAEMNNFLQEYSLEINYDYGQSKYVKTLTNEDIYEFVCIIEGDIRVRGVNLGGPGI